MVVSAASGCRVDSIDHGAFVCAPETCAGCCTASGQCLAGERNIFACGTGGASCQRCDVDQLCQAGACVVVSSIVDGGDGGQPACSPATCAGCCEEGVCVAAGNQSSAACGNGGQACASCGDGACILGVCAAPPACELVTITPTDSRPSHIDFGRWPVGGVETRWIEWRNDGALGCWISDLRWVEGSDQVTFNFGIHGVYDVVLGPGESIRHPVRFAPQIPWLWQSNANAFTWSVNGIPSPTQVVVTGEGVASAVPSIAAVIPEAIEFGQVEVNCPSQGRSALIVNTTNQTVAVTKVDVPAPFTATWPASVPPKSSAAIVVRLEPGAVGAVSGTMLVEHGLGTAQIALSGTGVASATRSETFSYPNARNADVLFVVHGGKSMIDTQDEFGLAAQRFVGTASSGSGYWWQAGVIRTDATLQSAGLLHGVPPQPYVTPTTPYAANALASNLSIGESGGLDMSFEAVRLSLIPWSQTAGVTPSAPRNPSFRRPNARLAVVLVSDDADRSGVSVSEFTRFLRIVAGVPFASERLRLYALVGGNGCAAGGDIEEVIAPIGGKCLCATSSLDCASDPTIATVSTVPDAFKTFADDLFDTPMTELLLTQRASQVLSVEVDGAPLVAGQHYQVDLSRSAVTFPTLYLPQAGQEVTVTYAAQCQP